MWCCRWHLASEGRSVSVSFIALHPPLLHPPRSRRARDQSFNGQTFHEHLLCAGLVPGMGEGRGETNAEGLACGFYMKTFSARLSLEHAAFLCSLEPLEHSQELLAEAGEVRELVWEGRRPSSCCHGHLKTSSLWKSLTSTHLHNPHRFCC